MPSGGSSGLGGAFIRMMGSVGTAMGQDSSGNDGNRYAIWENNFDGNPNNNIAAAGAAHKRGIFII